MRGDLDGLIRRRRARNHNSNPCLFILLALLLVGSGGLAVWVVMRVGADGKPEPRAVAKDEKKTPSTPATAPTAPKRPPLPPKQAVPDEEPVEKSPPSFDEAYAEAERMADRLAEEEPERTRKAMAVLTQGELDQARLAMAGPAAGERLFETFRSLVGHGLGVWVARTSDAVARADRGFKVAARAFWEPPSGPRGVLGMMNVWGCLNPLVRQMVVDAVKADRSASLLLPECRNAILELGGRKWLER